MLRSLTPLVTAAVLALLAPAATATAASAAPASPSATYKNCKELNRRYPHGVGRSGARDRTSGTPVRNFAVNNALYNRVKKKLDRDKDGIACEKGGGSGSSAPSATSPTRRPSTPSVNRATGPTVKTSGSVAFTTPSGNITCKSESDFLFCTIENRTYRSTQRPFDCDERWGNAFYLYGRGGFLCSNLSLYGLAPASSAWFAQTDLEPFWTEYGPQAVLPYGWTLRNQRFSCTSETTGVTCTDLRTMRGVMISKAAYRIL